MGAGGQQVLKPGGRVVAVEAGGASCPEVAMLLAKEAGQGGLELSRQGVCEMSPMPTLVSKQGMEGGVTTGVCAVMMPIGGRHA